MSWYPRLTEESRTHDVRVQLTPAQNTDFTLEYTVGGTATAGSDFTIANSGTVTVPAGATLVTIPVKFIDDTEGEFDETIVLTLLDNPKIWLSSWGPKLTMTIAGNDGPPAESMFFAKRSHVAREASGTQGVVVRLKPAPATDITVNYTVGGTATPGSDFTIANSGTLSVPAGATTATIPVNVINDSAREFDDETVVLELIESAGYHPVEGTRYGSRHTLQIADDDGRYQSDLPIVRVFGGATVVEGERLPFTVTAEPAPKTDLRVWLWITDWVGSQGNVPLGYTRPGDTGLDKHVTIPAGRNSAVYWLPTHDDEYDDGTPFHVPGRGKIRVVTQPKIPRRYRAHPHDGGTGYVFDDDQSSTNGISKVSFAAASLRVGEGTGAQDVKVRLKPAPTSDLTLAYTVEGTAVSGADYTALSGTLAVSAYATTATIPVTVIDDSAHEGDETVVLTLAAGSDYQVGRIGAHTLTIVDDDIPVASFARASQRADEGSGTHNVTVRLSLAPTADITLAYMVGGTATAGADYTALSGTLAVPKGATTATLPVALVDDSEQESSETVVLTLAAGSDYKVGSPGTHTLTIADDDTPTEPAVTIAADASPVTEGAEAVFTLTASPVPSADLPVTVTVAADGDYGISAGARTVTIPTTGSATLKLSTTGDAADEPDGSVTATVTDGDGYTVGAPASGTVAIADDDTPAASFARASQSAGEGSGTSDVTVDLSPAPLADLTLAYTVGGTATAGSDYTALSGTVTAPAGATAATIPVTLIDDNVQEGSKTVVLELAAGSDYQVGSPDTHVLTVLDDETPPTVSFEPLEGRIVSARTSWVREGSGTHHLKVTLDKAPASALAVKYTVSGSAAAGADYVALSGTVTVPAGATTATIPVTIIDDDEREHAEEIALWLVTDGPAYHVARPSSHHLIIDPSDGGPWVSFAALSHAAGEGSGTHEVGVRLGPAPSADVTFAYTVGGTATAGTDYTALSGTVTVLGGRDHGGRSR